MTDLRDANHCSITSAGSRGLLSGNRVSTFLKTARIRARDGCGKDTSVKCPCQEMTRRVAFSQKRPQTYVVEHRGEIIPARHLIEGATIDEDLTA
jgi:hypothetical protein